jgi:hypothetical protein
MTQGTVGSPIVPGAGSGLLLAEPLKDTWLSLNRYMKIMRVVGPPHFYGSYNGTVFPIKDCSAVVPRHGWQLTTVVSREEIAGEIALAEEELSKYMGFNLAPEFVRNELKMYPKPYEVLAVGSYGIGTNNLEISVPTSGARTLQAGIRGIDLIGSATTGGGGLDYTDEDSDGALETATITVATTETDACNLKVYVSGQSGDPRWEIRDPRRKYISGGNVVFEFDIWLFINPDIDSRYPEEEQYRAIDFADTANLVTSVDIYKESVDNTQPSVRFFWENTGGDASAQIYQDGVLVVRDSAAGEVIPRAATYNADSNIWVTANWVVGRDPDQVRISYYAGSVSQKFLNGISCDPLSETYAKAIAYMATARLSGSVCSCDGVVKFFDSMQEDLALRAGGRSYAIMPGDLQNPFGTRRGEIMAYNLLSKVNGDDRKVEVALI